MIHDGKSRKLPFDPAEAVAHLRAKDAKLGALIDRVGAFALRLDALPSPFESLLESILYQQLHGKAAATIHRRVREYFKGDPAPSPFESLLESILYQQLHGKAAATIHRRVREYFGGDPAPQMLIDTPDDPLRACGVSFLSSLDAS